MATGVAGVLLLGMYTPASGGPHLVEIVKTFQKRHPDCRVQLIETGFVRDQMDWLRRDDIDLLAMRLPFDDPDLVTGPILSCEDRVVIVANDDPFG
jgi:DNA-binding transcriptional LysR family regulator